MKTRKFFGRLIAFALTLALTMSNVTVNPTAAAASKKITKLTVKATGATLYEGQKLTKAALKKAVKVKALYKGAKKAKKVKSFTCTQVGKVVKPSGGKFKLTVKAGGKKRTVKVPVAKVKSLQLSANGFSLVEGEAFKTSAFKAKAKVMAGYAGGIYMNISTYKVEVVSVTAKEVTLRATYGSIKSNKVTVKFVAKATATPSASAEPSVEPSVAPSASAEPSAEPSATVAPSASVSPSASVAPTATVTPTVKPTATPTVRPTTNPTVQPTVKPTATPKPTTAPTSTPKPTTAPSSSPAAKSYTVTVNSNSSNVSLNGRGLVFTNGKASETFPAGTSVTLTATDSNSYRFVRWASNGTQLSADKSYTFTVNANVTINAVFESVYTLTVKRVGGKGRVTVAGESLDFYSNVATVNLVPGNYNVVAVPTDDYNFVNMTDDTGKIILSTSTSYNVGLASNKTIIVNFAEAEKTVLVTYKNSVTNQVLKSEAVPFGETLVPSTNTNLSKSIFKGWQIGNTIYYGNSGDSEFYATSGESLSNTIKSLTAAKQPVTVMTYYVDDPTHYYQLTLNGGTVSDTSVITADGIAEGSYVTVVADEPASGKKFLAWEDGSGSKISYSSTYTFAMKGNTILTSTYVDEEVVADPEPLVFFTGNSYNVDYTKGMVTFTVAIEASGYEVIEWGIIKGTDVSTNDLTLEAVGTGTVSKNSCSSKDNRYYWTCNISKKSWFAAGTTHNVTAVVYAKVSNANGTKTIYSSGCSFTITNQ